MALCPTLRLSRAPKHVFLLFPDFQLKHGPSTSNLAITGTPSSCATFLRRCVMPDRLLFASRRASSGSLIGKKKPMASTWQGARAKSAVLAELLKKVAARTERIPISSLRVRQPLDGEPFGSRLGRRHATARAESEFPEKTLGAKMDRPASW